MEKNKKNIIKKNDLSELAKNLSQLYPTPEDGLEFYAHFQEELELAGVDLDRKKLDFRGEKTASVTVYNDLYYVDFGESNERKSIITYLMEYKTSQKDKTKTMSFPEAVEFFKTLVESLNGPIDANNLQSKKTTIKEEPKAKPYTEYYLNQKLKDSRSSPKTFKNILNGLLRSCSISEMRRAVKIFKMGLDIYDIFDKEKDCIVKQERVFIPEFNEDNIALSSFRYNRSLDPKGLRRKNAEKVLFGSHLIKRFDPKKPIIFSEGHSDTVVNLAKSFQCVTTGAATAPLKNFLDLLKGRTIHFYPDADTAGLKGVMNKILEIEGFNLKNPNDKISYKVFWWSEYYEKSIEETEDLSYEELLKHRKYSKIWWLKYMTKDTRPSSLISIDRLREEQDFIVNKSLRNLKSKYGLNSIPESIYIDNWTRLIREPVKQGFDFIDFHTKMNNSQGYLDYMEKYYVEL
jgi:hypothetical protein